MNNAAKKETKFLPNILLEKYPDIDMDDNTLVVLLDDLLELPLDWAQTIMILTAKNFEEEGTYARGHLVTLNDEATAKAMDLISKDLVRLIVVGHPVIKGANGETCIWDLVVLQNDERVKANNAEYNTNVFVGGENFRKFCDHHNLHYKTIIDPEGKVMSSSELQYLKDDGEDCRKPIKDYTK